MMGDPMGLFVGLLAISAGALEIHGRRRLGRRDPRGMNWLVRAQLLLLVVVLVYAISRVASYDGDLAVANLTPEMRAALQEMQLDPAELEPMVQLVVWVGYGSIMLVTCFYQGGLSIYYRSRKALVTQALKTAPFAAAAAAAPPVAHTIDPKLYDRVAAEMNADQAKPGLWAQALAESGGHETTCQAIYIRLRVAQMQQESIPAAGSAPRPSNQSA